MATKKQGKTDLRHFDSVEQEAFLNIWRTYDCLKAIEEKLFSQYDLSAQQYNALRLLRSCYPQPMPTLQVGKRLISRSPDITRMLDRLEARSLIERTRRQENRRVVEVALTNDGMDLLGKLDTFVTAMHEEQLGHLSKVQKKSLIELLRLARDPHEDSSCDWLD